MNRLAQIFVASAPWALPGCIAGQHLQLAAADSMDFLTVSLGTAMDEYRADLEALDRQRQIDVIDAFIARVRSDHDDPLALERHAADFIAALQRLEDDRRVTERRAHAASENLETIKDLAQGLRTTALKSMTLDDQARHYLAPVLSQSRAPDAQTQSRDR